MFESNTYENIMKNVLENAPDDIDTRPGSIFYDAISGIAIEIAGFYTSLELIFSLSQISTASGEYLDAKASEYGIIRHEAERAQYRALLKGSPPDDGERFFCNGLYFALKNAGCFEAEEAGTKYNNIIAGTKAVPVDTAEGLESSEFGEIIKYGTDPEDDESLRRRLLDKISGTGENGNRQHYKIWCESISGVGKAKIFPLWDGANTVKAVLIDHNGLPCSEDTVATVQKYVDPDDSGRTKTIGGTVYNIGDGLGEGTAPIGAHFTAISAASSIIDISFSAELSEGTSAESVKSSFEPAVKNYFKNLVMESNDSENITVRLSAIGAVISDISGIIDYSGLNLNGDDSNISVSATEVPVLGVVEIAVI